MVMACLFLVADARVSPHVLAGPLPAVTMVNRRHQKLSRSHRPTREK